MIHGRQSTILKDLLPVTTYHLRIKAFNEKGSGPLSDVFLVKTNLRHYTFYLEEIARSIFQFFNCMGLPSFVENAILLSGCIKKRSYV
uniref:Fibronectin type-III domain-containing protein n=1 Tax=Romanomermis culicivorax TaxID=13658 RepID=A0A915J346_ROMCU